MCTVLPPPGVNPTAVNKDISQLMPPMGFFFLQNDPFIVVRPWDTDLHDQSASYLSKLPTTASPVLDSNSQSQ